MNDIDRICNALRGGAKETGWEETSPGEYTKFEVMIIKRVKYVAKGKGKYSHEQ